jgi:hypothetical protein
MGFETGGDRSFRRRRLEIRIFEEEGATVEEQQLRRRADRFPFFFLSLARGGPAFDG